MKSERFAPFTDFAFRYGGHLPERWDRDGALDAALGQLSHDQMAALAACLEVMLATLSSAEMLGLLGRGARIDADLTDAKKVKAFAEATLSRLKV